MTRSPTLEDVLREAMTARLMDMHVALPARVERYNAAEQWVDAKPLLKRSFTTIDGEEISESLPIVPKVPVMFPRAGGFFLSLPIAKGDCVLLVFNERSIDAWTAKAGEEVDPVDARMHSLSDAVAFPCFYPFSRSLKDAHADEMVVGKDGDIQLHVRDGQMEISLTGKGSKAAAVADFLQVWLVAHTHPTGTGPSGPPAQAWDPKINSNKLKIPEN